MLFTSWYSSGMNYSIVPLKLRILPVVLTGTGCTSNYWVILKLLSVLKMQRYFTSVLANFNQTILKMYIQYILMTRCTYRHYHVFKGQHFNNSLSLPVLYLLRIKHSMICFSGTSETCRVKHQVWKHRI